MRSVLFTGMAVALVVGVVAVVAQLLQQDESTGRVEVVGDWVSLNPTADWLVIEAGSQTSGAQTVAFTNTGPFPIVIEDLTIHHSNPAMLGTLTLDFQRQSDVGCTLGWSDSYPLTVNDQVVPVGLVVPVSGTDPVCAELLYDGSLLTNEVDDLTFTFSSHAE